MTTKTERLAQYQVDTGEVRQALEARVWGEGRIRAYDVADTLMQWLKDGMLRESFCLRCGHRWTRRNAQLPMNCPKCKSPYWNTPRRK